MAKHIDSRDKLACLGSNLNFDMSHLCDLG